jgi:hypothetical protein
MKQINNIEEYLTGDYKQIVSLIGVESFIKLLDYYSKTAIYFSVQPIIPLQKQFILQNKDKSPKEIARVLNCSERFVYSVMTENDLHESQLNIFEP